MAALMEPPDNATFGPLHYPLMGVWVGAALRE
jgi:hypothetical protein